MKIKAFVLRHKEVILYLFFGGCTTLVNIISFYACDKLGMSTSLSALTSWIISVIFALSQIKYLCLKAENQVLKTFYGKLCSSYSSEP